jgi:hypothetical protein
MLHELPTDLINYLLLGAVLVERAASVREGFSQEAPLVYSFGDKTPSSNMTLYNILVQKMGSDIHAKMASNKKGAITNCFSCCASADYPNSTQAMEWMGILLEVPWKLSHSCHVKSPFLRLVHFLL